MSVDSAFATNTKTSASRQNLSIQKSMSAVTSIPGLVGDGGVGGEKCEKRPYIVTSISMCEQWEIDL